ncbi:MAG: HEAT repeat domain-containing protein [Pirellulales bacterium]|nr:HEAT repeat domain-containing protein [Pirellulales bacterium]
MSTGLRLTFDLLARSENRAATELLIMTLDCPDRVIQQRGLAALMDRLDPDGHQEVFRRLSILDPACRDVVRRRAHRLETMATAAVRAASVSECQAACEAVVEFRLYDTLPGLVSVLGDENSQTRVIAAQTLLRLAEAFYQELSGADNATSTTKASDMDTMRHRVTTSLEEAARKYYKHQQAEAVEAFLLVARPQNVTLRQLLRNPDDKCHEALLDLLTHSRRGGVMRLLLGFLDDAQLPRPIIDVLASRRDKRFVKHLLRRVTASDARLRSCGETLGRFDKLAWARPDDPVLEALDDDDQAAAVRVIMASGMPEAEKIEAVGHVLQRGKVGGRRAAARALAAIKGPAADALVVRAVSDEDPEVRAAVLRQFRSRGIPGALLLLIRMVDSPHAVIREALRDALPEFSFRQFMMTFEALPENLQLISGHLVRQIDPDAAAHLVHEMAVPSPVRRRRAVQAAGAMGLVKEIEVHVARLVADEDHMVRAAAAAALAESESTRSWEALRDAMFDRSVVVQEAAEQSLLRISQAFLSGDSPAADAEPPAAQPTVPSQEEVAP